MCLNMRASTIVFLISFYILQVHCKKHDLHHKHGYYHEYSLMGLLLLLKVKAVLVVLAVWGGAILTVKVLLALLWPLISSYGHKFFGHHNHHDFEFGPHIHPYYPKNTDYEIYEEPEPTPFTQPSQGYKRWNRRTQKRNETNLSGYK